MESQFARQPWKWRSSLARKIFCLGKRRVTVLRTFLFHPGGTWKTFFFPFQSSKDPLHSSRSKKMKRDVRRGSFHHAWKNFVNSYPSIRLLQTATSEITVAPFPPPPPHLVDTLLKRDESGRGQGTVMGHYFCRGNWNFFPPFRNIAPERIVSSRAVIVSSSLPPTFRPFSRSYLIFSILPSLPPSFHRVAPILLSSSPTSGSSNSGSSDICPFIRFFLPARSRNDLPERGWKTSFTDD